MTIDLVDALRQNYIAYFRLFDGQHGVSFHEDEEVAWIIANRPPGNHILRANFAPDRADERIEALMQTISRKTGGIRWLIFPTDQPHDLDHRLIRRGWQTDNGDQWMFRPLQQIPTQPRPGACRIQQVTDMPALRAWWAASARGFGTSQRAAHVWYDAYRRHGFGPDVYARNYIGQVDRETVTSATLILAGGIAGVYDLSTPLPFRGRGYASALVGYMLAAARRWGYSHAGLQTADAVPFYQGLGFEVGFQEREFFWAADKVKGTKKKPSR